MPGGGKPSSRMGFGSAIKRDDGAHAIAMEMIEAMRYVAPVGEEDSLINHILEIMAANEVPAFEALRA